jgi:hypothetical protein
LTTTRDWEATFRAWTGPSSPTEEAKRDRAEEEIRQALRKFAPLTDRTFKVYTKGSYKNNTNVRLDSDVDICAELTEFFKYDRSENTANATLDQLGVVPYTGDYSIERFKNEVEQALVAQFGRSAVTRGPIALTVREARTTLPADIVPCTELREYYFDSGGKSQFRQGTRIFPDTGVPFENYPQQQFDNGVAKNVRTGRRFKQLVRVLKRLENELSSAGKIKELPSYFVECLVYNVDDSLFGHDRYIDDVRATLGAIFGAATNDAKAATWMEVNGIKYLFHTSQSWTRGEAEKFTVAAWSHVGFQ